MRVLLDCRTSDGSELGRYTTGLARALAARDDVELLQLVARGSVPPLPGEASVPESPGFPAIGGPVTAGRIAAARPDVVHFLGVPAPAPAGLPMVLSIPDIIPLAVPGIVSWGPGRTGYRRRLRGAIKRADALITVSDFSAEEIDRIVGVGGRVMTVTPLAAGQVADATREPLPADLEAWLGTAPVIVSMGDTRRHRDLPVLLAAFQIMTTRASADARPAGPRLVLAGSSVPSYLEGWLTDPSAATAARFSGPLSDGRLRTLLERASVFVFPSRYEGFGIPPLEAMACGTPTIVADSASLPEVAGDGALLFPPTDSAALADAITRVLGDESLRADLARRGLLRAGEFSWRRTADETVGVYERAAAEARERRG